MQGKFYQGQNIILKTLLSYILGSTVKGNCLFNILKMLLNYTKYNFIII